MVPTQISYHVFRQRVFFWPPYNHSCVFVNVLPTALLLENSSNNCWSLHSSFEYLILMCMRKVVILYQNRIWCIRYEYMYVRYVCMTSYASSWSWFTLLCYLSCRGDKIIVCIWLPPDGHAPILERFGSEKF